MMILTNGLTDAADEGFLKVANSLVKRMKAARPDLFVASYDRKTELSDRHLSLNKLLLNGALFSLLRRQRGPVLYLPFPARSLATAARIFVLSRMSRHPVYALLVMKDEMNGLAKTLLRCSGAKLLVLSGEAERFYRAILPAERIRYLKTGIDTRRFIPVSRERAAQLKAQYGFDPGRPVVLHVGHLNEGRGVGELLKIDPACQVLLVVSTLTKKEQDPGLRRLLLQRPNIRILEDYIPNIEEIYQLCDAYFFPVRQAGRCIDVPLSCLEAAACDKPVVTTAYGEMGEFVGKSGFFFMEDPEPGTINTLLEQAIRCESPNTRTAVLDYDWDLAVEELLKL